MLPKLLAPASIKDHPDIAVQVLTMIAHTPPAGAAAALRGRAQRKDYTPTLPNITVPTLIVVGTEDAYTNVDTAKQMQQSIPNSHLEIFPGIGHLPNLEAPDRFNAVLHHFPGTQIPTRTKTKSSAPAAHPAPREPCRRFCTSLFRCRTSTVSTTKSTTAVPSVRRLRIHAADIRPIVRR